MTGKLLTSRFTKFCFALSVTAFVLLEISTAFFQLNYGNLIGIPLNMLAAFILILFLEQKHNLLNKLFEFKSSKFFLISFSIAIYLVREIVLAFQKFRIEKILLKIAENDRAKIIYTSLPAPLLWFMQYGVLIILGFMAFFCIFAMTYAMVSRFKKYIVQPISKAFLSMDKIEWWYIIIGFILLAALVIFVYSTTEIFYTTKILHDNIYTLDSARLIDEDAFFTFYSPENDIRQPLFALSTIPFAIIAKLLSRLFFFLPNGYIVIMQLIQLVALLIMAVLIMRMAEIKDKFSKIMFLITYSITYPVLFFSLAIEQYIPSTFMLILTIYISYYKENKYKNLLALSSGTLLTNAIIVPFVTFNKNLCNWIYTIIKVVKTFIIMCVFCGKLPTLLHTFEKLKLFLQYTDIGLNKGTSSVDKLLQFSYFINSCFLRPATDMVTKDGSASFQLAMPTNINWVGIALLCFVLMGVIANKELLFAKICGWWVSFAIILLLIIGWGAPENGMILYSLYFSWAFFSLAFLLLEKWLAKLKFAKYIVYIVVFAIVAISNINGIWSLVNFGIKYYPIG